MWVNPAFTRVTGYAYDEAVGRNCRFLQGSSTDQAALQELRAGMRDRRPVTVTLLNHRKDGTAFWNQVSVSPVFDGLHQERTDVDTFCCQPGQWGGAELG